MDYVFILEDDLERIKWFREELGQRNIKFDLTDNAETAKVLLEENKYDTIFLDHDLGGQVYVNSNEPNTGYQVAKMIHTTKNKDAEIIIHSWNSVGAENMYEVLLQTDCRNTVLAKFGSFKIS